ncbi:glycosyltransferase [Metabacillus herbersteinensis]|uniref:Glycosyltransferase n=1 Tax=Metabacillus herbersteinensis TaxID=283816 RepID=A0ABV6GE15_9BACI
MSNKYDKSVYNENYYKTSLGGVPYNRDSFNGQWIKFFSNIGKRMLKEYDLKRVLDVGCAKGFLVECLRDMNVEAYGFDISEYAISNVREDIEPFCNVGSIDDPEQYRGFYDFITCIEVLEHVPEDMAIKAIELMCNNSNRIIFSSSPTDLEEPTHINVQPPEYWDLLFAKQGFFKAMDNWAAEVVADHAVIYEKYSCSIISEKVNLLAEESNRINTLYPNTENIYELTRTIFSLVDESKKIQSKKEKLLKKIKNISDEKKIINNLLQKLLLQEKFEFPQIDMVNNVENSIKEKETILQKQIVELDQLLEIINGKLNLCSKKYKENQSIWNKEQNLWNTGYNKWLQNTEPLSQVELEKQVYNIFFLKEKPLISILMPVYKIPLHLLKETINSVLNQTYPYWELCIAFADSDNKETSNYLKKISQERPQIKLEFLKKNEGISNNTNHCLKMAAGEFIALLDHDDLLTENALYEMVRNINENPKVDFLYSDKDLINDTSLTRSSPLFKHRWSWVTMLSANFPTHFTLIRKSLFSKIGQFDSEVDGAQDWDIFLKASEFAREIVHVPRILYHWRITSSSTASGIEAKPYAKESQIKVLKRYIKKRGLNADLISKKDGTFKLNWDLNHKRSFNVLIYFEGEEGIGKLIDTLNSLKQQYSKPNNVTVIVPEKFFMNDNLIEEYYGYFNIDILIEDKINLLNNLSGLNDNNAVNLLILKVGISFENKKLTNDLNAWIQESGYYAASGKLINEQGSIINAGYVVNNNKELIEPYKNMGDNAHTTYGSVNWYREYTAVSECCLMVNREIFEKILSFYKLRKLDRSTIIKTQIFLSQRYNCGMLYDPFLEIKSTSSLPSIESIETSLKITDKYFHSSVWDWNPDFLEKNQMDRKSKILNKIEVKNSVGLEIGPLANPIVRKEEGKVYYVDHTSTEELIKKYRNDPNVDVAKIGHVDFLWGEKTLREAIPSRLYFDYVVASHVIEHVPDVIGWLAELNEILKVGGSVCLAIPDKRYTFDYFRQLTTAADMIDAYLNKFRRPSPKQIFDFHSNAVKIDVFDAWNDNIDVVNCQRFSTDESALNLCLESIEKKTYIDVHCTVCTAHSFLELLKDLFPLNLINFKVSKFYKPEKYSLEFIMILEKLPEIENPAEKIRIQLDSLPVLE